MTDMIAWMVSASVLILLVIVLRRLLRGRISLRLQYALWLLVLVRLLIPGTVGESAISVQRPLESSQTYEVLGLLPEDTYYEEDGDIQMVRGGRPGDTFFQREDGTYGGYVNRDDTFLSAPQIVKWTEWKNLALWAWYAGMAVTGLLLLLSNLTFYRRLRRSRKRIETDASAKVYVTDAIQSPCLFGVPFPAIYVPAAVAEEPEALGHVLAHELSHRRHGDHIWTALRGICLVLHWYNPLVWWAAALSRRDCELACDEAAVKRLGEAQRAAYGRTLVGLAERRSGLMRCATSMSGSDLKERIAALVARPATRRTAAGVLAAAMVVFAVCTFTGAREPSRNWSTPEEFAAWVEGNMTAATVRIYSVGLEEAAYKTLAVDGDWVVNNITGRFVDYQWTEASDPVPDEGLCLEVKVAGSVLRLYESDLVELEGPDATARYQAVYRYSPDVISDSIFCVCRDRYDETLLGSLTDMSLMRWPDVGSRAEEALYALWDSWLGEWLENQTPGSRWGIRGYHISAAVTEQIVSDSGDAARAVWEATIQLEPEDYENTSWWIGNAVGAEVDNGADYAGWIELGYQGWLIYDADSGTWSIPDFGTGAYTIEDLLVTYPLPVEAGDVIHLFPYEASLGTEDGAWGVAQAIPEALTAYIPAGAEVTGYGAVPIADWATFTWGDTSYTLLAREGYPSGNWLDILVDWKGLDTEDVIYDRLSTSGLVDFYTSDQDTGAASWKWGDVTYVLETAGQTDAVEKLEALLAWCPEPLLGTSTSSSEEEAAVYVYEKEGFGGPFTIELYPDGTFQYYEGYLSSYIGFGTWEMDGNLLTLREHDYGLVNHFTITPEGLVFQAEGSDNFFYKEVAEGDRFLGPPLETEAGEEDI